MRAVLLSSTIVLVCSLLTGCDEGTDDAEFREAGRPGNGDITLYFGGEAHVPGCDIWDFMGTGIHDAADPDAPPILSVVGDEIYDADGTVQCYRSGNEFIGLVNRDDNDDVVFSVVEDRVYAGELYLDGTWEENLQEMNDKLLHTYQGAHVYDGDEIGSPETRLVSASASLEFTTEMRKFAISSLIEGECGGPGLPYSPWH